MLSFSARWNERGGYREFLGLAFPLIISTASWTIQQFVDRMFLAWYSPEAIAAAMPAGLLNFAIMCVFLGTAGYTGTFVAQYYGAGVYHRIGPSVWQGIYISLVGGIVLLAFVPLAKPLFALAGHEPLVQKYETTYFRILCMGSFFPIASSALSGFFSGMGRTWPVMWVNLLATLVNVVLDYAMIFGKAGFPEMGIGGAAIATVISGIFSFVVFLILFFRHAEQVKYKTVSGWRPDRKLFSSVFRFGFPSGVQFAIDMAGFTIFILIIGRLGTENLAATNIAFNINTIAFMPMLGAGIAISVLVGQYIGMEKPDLAVRSTYSGMHLIVAYMGLISMLYLVVPHFFVNIYSMGAAVGSMERIGALTVTLLRFVAFYSFFDSLSIVFSSTLKGAGDTRFIMKAIVLSSVFLLVLPTWLAVSFFKDSLFLCWSIATLYIIVLGIIFFLRFKHGAWKKMRVIESHAVLVDLNEGGNNT